MEKIVAINEKSGNILRQDAIANAMENVKVTFQVVWNGDKAFNGYHMVFDITIEYFCQKAQLVVGGHVAHTPDIITYSMANRAMAHIALTVAVLHARIPKLSNPNRQWPDGSNKGLTPFRSQGQTIPNQEAVRCFQCRETS